ncbi:MAG: NAD(P)-dependent oxidoreductase [Chloroherpetonaceae bacterium]|nr:NAD(P)-dependent oxidoreductase [Chthonomonadaceae bacterium]MDW8209398.1 NAD(P)-dependent oxidoreductase [Chloroherpetonaceae bacterium]
MKILITGARGNFQTALIPRLRAEEHELVLFDIEPMDEPEGCRAIQADIRDAAAVTYAMQGCDAVIHAAAYHSNLLGRRNEDDFYGVNVTGTHNVLRAMLLHGVHALVFSSSEVVYGAGAMTARTITEQTPCIPTDYYALTRWLGEEMCRYYARAHHCHIAILRYGCFSPADWIQAGIGRLENWIDREDVAQANQLALGAVIAEAFSCETFLIHCATPFSEDDWPELEIDPAAVVERYYPGAVELLAEHGIAVPTVHHRYDISKAVTLLGFDPEHTFERFLAELRQRSTPHRDTPDIHP